MFLDVLNGAVDWRRLYSLCIGFINPRPIALVSTVDTAGRTNLAPFSFYNMVSANPPVVMFCPSVQRDGSDKHTYANVVATGEFVIATVVPAMGPPMAACGAPLPAGQSEFDFSGLTPAPARFVRASLVQESPVNIECRLRQVVTFGEQSGAGRVVLGDVLAVHLAKEVLAPDGSIDPHKLVTVGRLGGSWYCDTQQPYELKIPNRGPASSG